MIFYTHLAAGLLTGLLLNIVITFQNPSLILIVSTFASLLPDIDTSRSFIGSKNKILSKTIEFLFGHRNFFHSIFPPLILFLVFFPINIEIATALSFGYLSHIVLDGLTKAGIMPFYPFSRKKMKGLFTTGSLLESILLIFIVFLDLYFIFRFL